MAEKDLATIGPLCKRKFRYC